MNIYAFCLSVFQYTIHAVLYTSLVRLVSNAYFECNCKSIFLWYFFFATEKNELLSLIRLERNIWLFSCVVFLFNAVHKIHEITL